MSTSDLYQMMNNTVQKDWTYGIVECTPLGVDDHLPATGLESLVLELSQFAQVLNIGSVGPSSEDCTKYTTTGGVRSREESANGLYEGVRTATLRSRLVLDAYIVHQSDALDVQMLPVKCVLEELHNIVTDGVLCRKA